MSAVTSIVLPDAQATPVNHYFIPLGPDENQVWWYEDQSTSTPIGYNRVSISLRRPKMAKVSENAGSRTARVTLTIHTPVLETIGIADSGTTPPPSIAFVPKVTCEFVISERSTSQHRKDLRKYMLSLLADTQVVNAIENLQGIY